MADRDSRHEMSPARKLLAGLSREERYRLKAAAQAAQGAKGDRFTIDGVTITLLSDPEVIERPGRAPLLRVRVAARDRLGRVIDIDPDQQFVNPPLGQEAFREMLRDAVRTQARR
jgi:hypothetical protein